MRFAISAPNVGEPDALVHLAIEAEQGGWDALFLWDHLHMVRAMRLDTVDPMVTLGAIASRTERILLGAMVTPVSRRRPWKLAKELTTLDRLSDGRLVIGVGLGAPADDEFAAFGEPSDDRQRAELLDEGLQVLNGCLRGGPFRHDGRHFHVDVDFHPASVQQPRPPIWVAGMWPNRAPLRRARRFEGFYPVSPDGEPVGPQAIAEIVAELQPPAEFDVVAPWAEGQAAADYERAGATWLVESRWPVGSWYDDLLSLAEAGPSAG